ncbi:B3 domain-containing protein REM10 isoform X1 [Brassica rapa]|uniref:B3 domain-containing protein REM10 isoform X1 n=1 Tax=Brassica campestris TaxID=3711 RepID=UPI00142D2B83|nr:B3 domain-containing protein REM10 isoform X1 [Brassica rapa]XP_048597408.1 B3 domain-containing protein REM10 isoform X1 [Brassica napus]
MALCSPTNPHFFQPLLPGFTKHLDIPVAFFLKHLDKRNKGKTAKLRSDTSETTWNVKLDGRRFSDGWEYFAVAHDLRVGDIVVFRHEGELAFHVTALGPSCCEIQYGEDSQEEDKSGELCDAMEEISRKKKRPKTEIDFSKDQSCFVITVTPSNLRRDTVYLPKAFAVVNCLMKKFEIVLVNEERESWKLNLRQDSYLGRFYMSNGWRSFCVANGKKPEDMFTFKMVQNETTPVLKLLPWNNEDLHNPEKVPKKKHQEIEADSSFVAIVTASNIRRDTMYLPKTFAASNGLKSKFKIDLMNEKGESWTIDLRHEPYSGRFLIRSGWRSFCAANGKKPGDMFNFKLIRNVETPVLKLFPLNLPKLEPSEDTRQGLEATEREFLGVETNRDDSRQEAIRKGKWLEANEITIKEENISTTENRFVTLTLTTSKLVSSTTKLLCVFLLFFFTCYGMKSKEQNLQNLPLEFTKGNGIKKAEKIKMIDRYGTTWSTSLLMNKKKRGEMKLGKGCKGFCEVNGVRMGESFVLELVWEDTVPVLKFCYKC